MTVTVSCSALHLHPDVLASGRMPIVTDRADRPRRSQILAVFSPFISHTGLAEVPRSDRRRFRPSLTVVRETPESVFLNVSDTRPASRRALRVGHNALNLADGPARARARRVAISAGGVANDRTRKPGGHPALSSNEPVGGYRNARERCAISRCLSS